MLADEIIAARDTFMDKLQGGALTKLGDQVKAAQRFDLSPEVMRSAQTIMLSSVDAQLRALPLCQLPFSDTWFEWPGNYSGEPSTRAGAPVPKRMGALVRCDENLQRGTIVYAWEQDSGLNICPLSLVFDWREEPAPLNDLTNATEWHLAKSEADWHQMRQKFPRVRNSSREAIVNENHRFGVIYNPLTRRLLDMAAATTHFGKLMRSAMSDIEGEGPLLRAAIMLLNSRNLAQREPRPISDKLNRSRAKNGKPPLLNYTHIRIKLSRALAMRAGGAIDPRAPSRLHLVSGHYKIRKSGIFWWSPHPRGNSEAGVIHHQTRHAI